MATSSFSKNFVINDPNAIKDLLQAIEHPTEITLKKKNVPQEEQRKQDLLCAIKKQLASAN
nr:hypothetical protein [uncultured Haemophilus sp.]